jgi:hypothetical protein
MIATKQKKSFVCTKCSHSQAKWTGQCMSCKKWNCMDEVAIAPKVYKIPTQSEKTKKAIKDSKGVPTELDLFFDKVREIELQGKCRCENCNRSVRNMLNSEEKWIWRTCISHIAEKSKFGSVACEINNYTLSCGDCHSQWGTNWSNAMKMPVFKIAKERFKLFAHKITENTTHLPKELIN